MNTNNNEMRNVVRLMSLAFVLACVGPLSSEPIVYFLGVTGGKNRGLQVLNYGQSFDLRGDYGSVLTYDRRFNYGGVLAGTRTGKNEFSFSFVTTGWYVKSGRLIDQDVYCSPCSVDRAHIDLKRVRLNDSAYEYTGFQGEFRGDMYNKISDYSPRLEWKRYFSDDRSGFFLNAALDYSYFKYRNGDLIQTDTFTQVYLKPFDFNGYYHGPTSSFSNSQLSFTPGIGYLIGTDGLVFGFSGGAIFVYDRTRDFHALRETTFGSRMYGSGYEVRFTPEYRFEGYRIRLDGVFHRLFVEGGQTIALGPGALFQYGFEALGANGSNAYGNYHLNTRDSRLQLSVTKDL